MASLLVLAGAFPNVVVADVFVLLVLDRVFRQTRLLRRWWRSGSHDVCGNTLWLHVFPRRRRELVLLVSLELSGRLRTDDCDPLSPSDTSAEGLSSASD